MITKLSFIQSFTWVPQKKEFQVDSLIETASNRRDQKEIRILIIQLFELLRKSKRIEPGFEVLLKTNQRKKVVKLTAKNYSIFNSLK